MKKLPKDVIDLTGKVKPESLEVQDARQIGEAIGAGKLSEAVMSELVQVAPGLIGLQVKSITQTLDTARQVHANQRHVIDQLKESSTQALATLSSIAQSSDDEATRLRVVEAIAEIQAKQFQVLQDVNRDNNLTIRDVVKAMVGVAAMAGGVGMATRYLFKSKG